MCGIVGYIGQLDAREIILKGLHRLEYRGYDSAGMALRNTETSQYLVFKDKGRVNDLEQITDFAFPTGQGIGHTRWATHGVPNQVNSHPHSSLTHRFHIVHNGVIDNFNELREEYLSGSHFESDTDTEVIAHLIEKFNETMTISEAIRKTMTVLEGSYALAIVDSQNTGMLYAAKNKSPLLLGVSDKGMLIGSDVMALVGYASKYVPLPDKSYIEVSEEGYQVFDIIGKEILCEEKEINVDYLNIEKGEYSHFMLKEINEQPSVIRRIVSKYFDELGNIKRLRKEVLDVFKESDRIYIIGAGTSMNAGFIGKELLEKMAGIPVEVHIASEFAYNQPLLSKKPLFMFISQSGETADLRAVLVNAKTQGHRTITLTNVKTSTLAREADYYLNLYAGPEIAVASTKAYTAQIAVLSIIAYGLSERRIDIRKELSKVAYSIERIIEQKDYIESLVKDILTKRNCFYIGRGIDYFAGLESALKLKEISYIQTEGFAAGELKHGTIALIEKDTPVIAIISQRSINKNTRSNLHEVVARGAKPLVISTKRVHESSDQIVVDDVFELFSPLLTVIPSQLIAYYAALHRGYDIDKPRNLAKSVTVE
jgi:glucosamine--fructose-6-phosphate aminotransferase (isomerizing)